VWGVECVCVCACVCVCLRVRVCHSAFKQIVDAV